MISVILPAAGTGTRAGFSANKVLLPYLGLPVLCYSLSAFSREDVDEILVPCAEKDERTVRALLSPFPKARPVRGGATRFESVFSALKEAQGKIVLVHDAARPFVTKQLIDNCLQSVLRFGSGICSLPAEDTIVFCEEGKILSAPPRETLRSVQTPQGFRREPLLRAFSLAAAEGRQFTDESGVYAAYIGQPVLFPGSRSNRKLTHREDFLPAERVGIGADTHAFGAPRDFITLAGVRIPAKSGLVAHSDGDVLVHALMDALLSAAGLRDIGFYFPDTDVRFAGADSMELLGRTLSFIKTEQLVPQNISLCILAETPRLSPYSEPMKLAFSEALSLPLSAIGIAAGTNEKLGYVGEGKGITVLCAAMLRRCAKEAT